MIFNYKNEKAQLYWAFLVAERLELSNQNESHGGLIKVVEFY